MTNSNYLNILKISIDFSSYRNKNLNPSEESLRFNYALLYLKQNPHYFAI